MKILVISTPVFAVPISGYGGLEMISWLCAKGLAQKGHQVSLVAPEGSTCPDVEIISIGKAQTVDEKTAYSRYWGRLPDFDVIIDHSWSKWAYLLKTEGKLKAPILGVCHAPVNTMFVSPPPLEKPCIVCISEDQCAHYKALFGNGDARCCYNGVDVDHYKSIRVPRTDRFLFLARFSTVKSPDLAMIACKDAGVPLDLIGDTKLTGEPEYLQSILKQADGKQIRIVGPCSRGESVYWYSQARGFIHLNRVFREPFGLAPVEAQLCGTPVLAWDYGAMRETVKNGETGFLVKSMQGAVDVLKSGMMDSLDRERCREWASRFSVDRMVHRYEELCNEALSTGGW